MYRMLLSCSALLLMTACATGPAMKPDDVKRDVKTVTFVQNGKHANQLTIGAVDGKTFWAGQSVVGQPANSASRADQQAAVATSVVSLIGGVIAKAAIEKDQEQYKRVIDYVSSKRELGLESGRRVLPALARAWGVPFNASNVVVMNDTPFLTDSADRFLGADPGGDLVLAFSLQQVQFTEQVSVGAAVTGAFKLGMGSRDVTSEFVGVLLAFRRDASGELKRVWSTSCRNSLLSGHTVDWDTMSRSPERTKSVLDSSMAEFVNACGKAAQMELTAAR
jgi:hypothetical protein